MSERNGDRSRFNRERRKKILQRARNRALLAPTTKAPAKKQAAPAAKS